MNHSLESVKSFHELFSHPIGKIGELEPLKTRQLRIKLLFEELTELTEASDCRATLYDLCSLFQEDQNEMIGDGDNVDQLEELDALCDLQYVLNGKILTSGLHEVFDKNFDSVHENNMAKAHRDFEHAQQTIFRDINLRDGNMQEVNGKVVLTNSSGKVIKPWNHQKVKLTLNP